MKNCKLSIPPYTTYGGIINDKRKYKLQQLFKMLSLSLDTGTVVFSTVNDGLFEVSPDLNHFAVLV